VNQHPFVCPEWRTPHVQPALPFDTTNPRSHVPNPESHANPKSPIPNPEFIRHPRARRYVVRVRDDGTVRVTIPRWGSKREAREFAEQQRSWIEKQRRRVEEARVRPRVEVTPDVEREMRARARRELPARLLDLARQHGVAVSRVSVRNQRWRWGSCSRRGHICLNWRLAWMPEPVRDYVMIHELMHLKRMDHSRKFWKLVAQACPDYEAARQWLRAHQDMLS
jgi:predicted metal-dependent hydrolase